MLRWHGNPPENKRCSPVIFGRITSGAAIAAIITSIFVVDAAIDIVNDGDSPLGNPVGMAVDGIVGAAGNVMNQTSEDDDDNGDSLDENGNNNGCDPSSDPSCDPDDRRHSLDRQALNALIKEALDRDDRLSGQDAATVLDWAGELGIDGVRASPEDILGEHWAGGSHIYSGNG